MTWEALGQGQFLRLFERAEEVLISSYQDLHVNTMFYRLNQETIKEFGCSASKALVDLYEQTGQVNRHGNEP